MKKWFDGKREWFLKNREYLYNDLLSEKFVKVHDEQLNKNYYEFLPSDFDIALLEAIADEKSKYTNNNNQYDEYRTPEQKKNKQFEGCLAELATAKFLVHVFDERPNNIHIYDSERIDFDYRPGEEFDIKVIKNKVEKRCEVRNSWSYKTNISEFCDKYDVLGTYTNESKKYEEMSDFFFRLVLQLNELSNSIPDNAIELVKEKKVKLYIVAACDKNQMLTMGGFNKKMSKGQTRYHTTKINLLNSVDSFKDLYNNLF
ncbi:hypothetical protein AB1J08_03595 [Staphylococcus cohnii species complex 1659]|uniref:hypothetical protein n=1 Tax=Staphylococcus cohnii species complex 1659 TaxID=3239423 RepID=UPI0034D97697